MSAIITINKPMKVRPANAAINAFSMLCAVFLPSVWSNQLQVFLEPRAVTRQTSKQFSKANIKQFSAGTHGQKETLLKRAYPRFFFILFLALSI
jgi:hypothetical protein